MLDKTNYTTRTDLTPEEVRALMTVRDKLESGEISVYSFNMGSCSACIGHYMGREMGMSQEEATLFVAKSAGPKFGGLFYPLGMGMGRLTVDAAAIAITNYLNGENNPWGDD